MIRRAQRSRTSIYASCLQQIREEALQRELYSTRLALVRKMPPCLLNQHNMADDSVSGEIVKFAT